jgi:hypothetical protein
MMAASFKSAAVAAVALLASVGARAELGDIHWEANGSAAREFQVAPGKFAEWCGNLGQGDTVQWRFEASGALDFNVHYHEGKDVRFPAKQDAVAKAEGLLEVALHQDYCWMWTNKSATPVALKVSLQRVR